MGSRHRRKTYVNLGFESLLELDGLAEGQKAAYWVKVQAHRVRISAGRPSGIKYSLTLHSPDGERVIGFDNAHSINAPGEVSNRVGLRAYDHWHYLNEVAPYQFKSGRQLLNDFYDEIARFLQEVCNEKEH